LLRSHGLMIDFGMAGRVAALLALKCKLWQAQSVIVPTFRSSEMGLRGI
jgi:hypothetical protein